METKNNTSKNAPSLLAVVFDYFEILILSVCFVLLMFTLLIRVSIVSGSSMEQTLSDKDMLIVSSLPYTPKTGDIVVFRAPFSRAYPDGHLIKRVIATEGQTIDIDYATWTVTVDGKVLDESGYLYLDPRHYLTGEIPLPYTVPEGCVFVMGDNRHNSHDSRTIDIGAVDARYILGPVLFRFAPLSKFGTVRAD